MKNATHKFIEIISSAEGYIILIKNKTWADNFQELNQYDKYNALKLRIKRFKKKANFLIFILLIWTLILGIGTLINSLVML